VFLQKTNKETHMKNGRKPNTFAAFVGIDWADRKHDFCLWDKEAGTPEFGRVEHRPALLHEWIASLRTRYPDQRIAVGLEQSRGALIHLMMQYEFIVLFIINPAASAQYRKTWKPSRAKDDPSDAALLMELVRDHRDKLKPWHPEDDPTRRLSLLTEHRRCAVNLRVKLTNQLRSALKAYYPLACEVAGDKLNEGMALNFLSRWPTLETLQRARPSTLRQFYHRLNSRYPKTIEKRIERIVQAQPLTTDAVIIESYARLVLMLVEQLKSLRKSIAEYDREISRLYTQHPEASIISTFPATGKVFGPRLIAALGTDRTRFDSAQAISSYSGIAPVTERSGKSEWVHRRWAAPAFIRQSFHEWAGETIRHSIWARAFYAEARERGMGHHQAVRALAFKWIRILYRCWSERKPYDELHYLSMLKKRGSSLKNEGQACGKPSWSTRKR
jgi:transposase